MECKCCIQKQLVKACKKNDLKTVRRALKKGGDIYEDDGEAVKEACLGYALDVLVYLLRKKCIDMENIYKIIRHHRIFVDKNPVFHIAYKTHGVQGLEYLMEKGLWDPVNERWEMIAAARYPEDLPLVKFMVNHGHSFRRFSELEYVAYCKDTMNYLAEKGGLRDLPVEELSWAVQACSANSGDLVHEYYVKRKDELSK